MDINQLVKLYSESKGYQLTFVELDIETLKGVETLTFCKVTRQGQTSNQNVWYSLKQGQFNRCLNPFNKSIEKTYLKAA